MFEQKCKIKGQFRPVVLNSAGEVVRDYGVQDNLILNSFFDKMATSNIIFDIRANTIGVGVGTGIPAITDTTLGSKVGVNSYPFNRTISATKGVVNGDIHCTVTYQADWPVGAIVGNLSELGINGSQSTSETLLVTRALFKDLAGNPTAITLTATEQLRIFYTLTYVILGTTFVNTVDGYTVTMRADYEGFEYSSLGSFSAGVFRENVSISPSLTDRATFSGLTSGVISPSITRGVGTVTGAYNLSVTQGDLPIGGLCFDGSYSGAGYQVTFSPKIPKTSNDTLVLTFKKTFGRA